MLPQAAERILAAVPDDAPVLQVGGFDAPFARADWVLDDRPYEGHGDAGGRERFTRRTWAVRDVCGRAPWPFADGEFAFAVCGTLAALRDPVGVCAELARVAAAGYVELPTIEAELAYGLDGEGPWLGRSAHRWLCDLRDGELTFVHKPHGLHADARVRVPPRWHARLAPEDRVHALFWEGRLPARERIVDPGALLDELAARVRRRFEPGTAEVALQEARDRARRLGGLAGDAVGRWRSR
jgi:hypothetical protein